VNRISKAVVFSVTLCFFGCAYPKPRPAIDPDYIAAFQKERRFWEKRAAETHTGMTRREVQILLPADESLPGVTGAGTYFSAGKTRTQAHTEEWYYVSPHFICSVEYDFTGLNYTPQVFLLAAHEDPNPEFPDRFAPGSDPLENIALSRATITLVEPGRIKKPK
jgi:hypothetical protein